MNKTELVAKVAERAKLTKLYATDAIDAVFAIITEAVDAGEVVKLSGFGSFSLKTTQDRIGRNPRTGEPVQIKASKSIKFAPSKSALE